MRKNFVKVFTVGFISIFSFTLASCGISSESDLDENNQSYTTRTVNFDFTSRARAAFNTELIDLPQVKTLVVGTNLYNIVNNISINYSAFIDSIYQDYIWRINTDYINQTTKLEENVTIYLDAVQTHKEVIANVILPEEVAGLNPGHLEDFREVVKLGTNVLENDDIKNTISEIIFNKAYSENIEIYFRDGLAGIVDDAKLSVFIIDVIVTNSYNDSYVPEEYSLFTIEFNLTIEDERFSSHLDLRGETFLFPNSILLDAPIFIAARHRIIRDAILERANVNNTTEIEFQLNDFGISTEGNFPLNEDGYFYINVTLPRFTEGLRSPGSIIIYYNESTYNIIVDSAVVQLTNQHLQIDVPHFLANARWNNVSNETVNLYDLFIFNKLSANNIFELINTEGIISRSIEETDFTFAQLEENQDGALFVLSVLETTILITDINNSGTIENNTNGILELIPGNDGIEFPRALVLDLEAINNIVLRQLEEMLINDSFVIEDFVIDNPNHLTALFNVNIANNNVQIVNIEEEFVINDETTYESPFGTFLEEALGGNLDFINIPRALINDASTVRSLVMGELESRITTQFMELLSILGLSNVFAFYNSYDVFFVVYVDINNNQIFIEDATSSFTNTVGVNTTDHGNEINTGADRLSVSNVSLHGININYAFFVNNDANAQLMSITLERRSHVVLYIGRVAFNNAANNQNNIAVWVNTKIEDISHLTRSQQLDHPAHTSIETIANINQAIGNPPGTSNGVPVVAEAGIGRIIIDLPAGTHTIGACVGTGNIPNRRILMIMVFNFDYEFTIDSTNNLGGILIPSNLPNWDNPSTWMLNQAPRLPKRDNLSAVMYFTSPSNNFNGINIIQGRSLNNFTIHEDLVREMPSEDYIRTRKWRATVRINMTSSGSGFAFYRIDNPDNSRYYLILTNEHVTRHNNNYTNIVRVYDYQYVGSDATIIHMCTHFDLSVLRIRRTNEPYLDLIEKASENATFGSDVMILSRAGQAAGVNIGTVTRFTYVSGNVNVRAMASTTHSAGGTSGSAVLNMDFELVAVHFASLANEVNHRPREALAIPIESVNVFLDNYIWHHIR